MSPSDPMREALEFYALCENWSHWQGVNNLRHCSPASQDGGAKARAALSVGGGHLLAPLGDVERGLHHHLANLQFKPTGKDPKSDGYAYAEIPDWALRHWLKRVEEQRGVQVSAVAMSEGSVAALSSAELTIDAVPGIPSESSLLSRAEAAERERDTILAEAFEWRDKFQAERANHAAIERERDEAVKALERLHDAISKMPRRTREFLSSLKAPVEGEAE